MNITPDPTAKASRIEGLLLNGWKRFATTTDLDARVQTSIARLVRENGGYFECSLGLCELRVIPGTGYAVFGIKCNEEQSVALAVLAWDSHQQEIVWDELVQTHCRMYRALGLPIGNTDLNPPSTLPWLAVSIAPKFIDSDRGEPTQSALSVVSAAAHAILKSVQRPCQPILN